MPSTIDVRSLASSAVQSCRYHRSMASTCSRNSLPVGWLLHRKVLRASPADAAEAAGEGFGCDPSR